jgi:hypothetical protein
MVWWWGSHGQSWGRKTVISPSCDTQDLQHAWGLLFPVLRVYLRVCGCMYVYLCKCAYLCVYFLSVCVHMSVCLFTVWCAVCPMLSELVVPQQCVSAESLQLSPTQLAIRIWPYLWPKHSALSVSITHSPFFLESAPTFCSWKWLLCQSDGMEIYGKIPYNYIAIRVQWLCPNGTLFPTLFPLWALVKTNSLYKKHRVPFGPQND